MEKERNTVKFQQNDLKDLKRAKNLLENPGIAAKLTNLIGIPIEKGFKMLPYNWNVKIGAITQVAINQGGPTFQHSGFRKSSCPGNPGNRCCRRFHSQHANQT